MEVGARFSNEIYVKIFFDPSNGDAVVTAILGQGEEQHVITGAVTWDD